MNPNYQGPFGNTLLHVAAADGDAREVQRLLAAGADPRIRNREGRTPMNSQPASSAAFATRG